MICIMVTSAPAWHSYIRNTAAIPANLTGWGGPSPNKEAGEIEVGLRPPVSFPDQKAISFVDSF